MSSTDYKWIDVTIYRLYFIWFWSTCCTWSADGAVMHDRSIALKTTALNVLTALTYHHSGPKCRPTVWTNKTQLHRHLRKCANMAALVSTWWRPAKARDVRVNESCCDKSSILKVNLQTNFIWVCWIVLFCVALLPQDYIMFIRVFVNPEPSHKVLLKRLCCLQDKPVLILFKC